MRNYNFYIYLKHQTNIICIIFYNNIMRVSIFVQERFPKKR